MSFDPLTAILDVSGKVLDKFFPDPVEKEKAKMELYKLQQEGQFKEIEVQMSAIIAEAKSPDPWTSRARPSFLYVMYALILGSIPIGILSIFNPLAAQTISNGMEAWLSSIPTELWTVFGIGYTGYTVARSAWDKKISNGKN
jgi:hypothetical protein